MSCMAGRRPWKYATEAAPIWDAVGLTIDGHRDVEWLRRAADAPPAGAVGLRPGLRIG
jgi:hypothetical protein